MPDRERPSWLRMRPVHPSARENTGSGARDHLANERTFLAWLRTGLGFVGLGIVVGELVEREGMTARLAGVVLIAFGGLVVAYATVRFRAVSGLLDRGLFRPAGWGPLLMGLLAVLVAGGALYFVLD